MNTPVDPNAWRQLQDHAAAQLRPDFAERVLRAARTPGRAHDRWRWAANPLVVSSTTVALCLALVVLVHSRLTDAASERHLAAWQEISAQTAALDPNP